MISSTTTPALQRIVAYEIGASGWTAIAWVFRPLLI
jgi:hypothetical protein